MINVEIVTNSLPETFFHIKTKYDSIKDFRCSVMHGILKEKQIDNEEVHANYFNMFKVTEENGDTHDTFDIINVINIFFTPQRLREEAELSNTNGLYDIGVDI